MADYIKLKQEMRLVKSFESLATAYQEISIYKMRLTRASILKNREFLEHLSEIFFDVRMSYMSILELLLRHHQKNGVIQFAGVQKNGKQVDILVTANTKLYGNIVNHVFDSFEREIQTHTSDLFIMGKVGKSLFDNLQSGRDYYYFEISDTDSTAESLAPIISKILPYEKVVVYYGKYVNVLTQTPVAVSISGDKPIEPPETPTHDFKFLFEPDLEEILHFFQSQVFTSLFNQSIHEGELARHASRITSMEETLKHIEEVFGKLNKKEKQLASDQIDKKQQEVLAGITLWGN